MKHVTYLSIFLMIMVSPQIIHGMQYDPLNEIEKKILLQEIQRRDKEEVSRQIKNIKDHKPDTYFTVRSRFYSNSDNAMFNNLIKPKIAKVEKLRGYIPKNIRTEIGGGVCIHCRSNKLGSYTLYYRKEDENGTNYIEVKSKFYDSRPLLELLKNQG